MGCLKLPYYPRQEASEKMEFFKKKTQGIFGERHFWGVSDYQYHLTDHLGNVRLTFSTTPENYTMVENFETGEENGWQDLHRATNSNANTTTGGDEVELLQSGQTGAMIFLSVNKRDTINLAVNANYESAPSNNNFLGTAYGALFTSFDNVFGSGVEGGVSSSSGVFDDALNGVDMSGKGNASTAPRAFLNYIFFDKDMQFETAGFTQISTAAQGVGVHELVQLDEPFIADQEGYILAYLSNENQEAVNVHFDDFEVYHGKTNVVFTSDYYPFGGQFREYQRTASTPQRYTTNGKEKDETTGILDYGVRTRDPWGGPGFMQVDPMAEEREWLSPYNFVQNNPVNRVDPDGALDDWYQNASGDMVYDENITSQADLDAAGIEGTYQGKEGFAINETTGDLQHYQADGTVREAAMTTGADVTVYGNPIEAAVYQGQDKFVDHPVTQGAFMIATSVIPVGGVVKGIGALGRLGKASTTGSRVFWSGGKQARLAAEGFAKSNGAATLEMTIQGKALTGLTNLMSYKLTAPLWNRASASFARGAKGSVNVFQNANTGVRLNSVWKTTEYPILKNKGSNIIFNNVFK